MKVLGIKTADGVQVFKEALTVDSVINNAAGFGTDIDKSVQMLYAPNALNQNYAELANMYEYWLPRKVVDIIPNEALRKPWKHKCPSLTPEQLVLIEKADRDFSVREKFRSAWKWSRLFGGGLVVYLFDQSMGVYSDEIDPKKVKKGSLLGIDSYDPWQAYSTNIEFSNITSEYYRKPTNYTLGTPGFLMNVNKGGISESDRGLTSSAGALIHTSRVARFEGLPLPWYRFQQNWYWGQSLLASVNEAIKNADLVTQSVAQLLFKLSVPVMKVKGLTEIVSDDIASGAFMKRMGLLNSMMSNNNMAVIDMEEELANLEQSGIAGIDSLIERFYVLVSAASGIPVSKLVGESAKGLNATGEGDEKNYFNMVEASRDDELYPQLDKFYDMFFPAVLGIERPDDHEIDFPKLHQESPQQIATTQNLEVTTLSILFGDGVINQKIYMEELQEKKIINNMTDEDIKEILNGSYLEEDDLEDAEEMGGSQMPKEEEKEEKEEPDAK